MKSSSYTCYYLILLTFLLFFWLLQSCIEFSGRVVGAEESNESVGE